MVTYRSLHAGLEKPATDTASLCAGRDSEVTEVPVGLARPTRRDSGKRARCGHRVVRDHAHECRCEPYPCSHGHRRPVAWWMPEGDASQPVQVDGTTPLQPVPEIQLVEPTQPLMSAPGVREQPALHRIVLEGIRKQGGQTTAVVPAQHPWIRLLVEAHRTQRGWRHPRVWAFMESTMVDTL